MHLRKEYVMKIHFARKQTPKKDGTSSLIDALDQACYDLETAYLGFEYVTDPDLIDSYIYEMNSILKKYRYLLQLLRQSSILTTDYAKNPLAEELSKNLFPCPSEP